MPSFIVAWSSLVARLAHNQEVVGSNPTAATIFHLPGAWWVAAIARVPCVGEMQMAWPTTSRQSRGYGRAHEKMRERVLSEEPLCRECLKHRRNTPTKIADHIVPKAEGGGDERANYQGLCEPCSDEKTAAEAARARGVTIGLPNGVDAAGRPTDPNHPWNRAREA